MDPANNYSFSFSGTGGEALGKEADSAAGEFGAVDIVNAFTALRHDLKLQIRLGADLHQTLEQRLDKLEKLSGNRVAAAEVPDSESRQMALALADMEEALQRAVQGLQGGGTRADDSQDRPGQILKQELATAGLIARVFAGGLLKRLDQCAERMDAVDNGRAQRSRTTLQGLELLLERAQRLLRQRQIERRDVVGMAFDSELMNAIDAVTATDVPPGHVAEQLKPAYLWRKQVLCFAEVRVARLD